MARIDALLVLGGKFHIDRVTTGRDGKTLTLFVHRPIHIGQGAISYALRDTGYMLTGFGNSVEKKQYFIEISPERGQSK